jgi:hypothetical protein
MPIGATRMVWNARGLIDALGNALLSILRSFEFSDSIYSASLTAANETELPEYHKLYRHI